MGLKFSNFGKAVVASAPDGVSGLSFTVEAGKGLLFPALGAGDYFYGIFKDASGNREIVKIETRSVDSMTIAVGGRGIDGTAARTWAAGDYFVAGITNIALNESLSNSNLISLGALVSAADKLPYFTGAGVADMTILTAFARQLLDDLDAAAMRETLDAAQDFPSGTSMLFYNPTAPVGWTHDLSTLDHALRVVAGAGVGANAGGTAGGTVNFVDAFKAQAVTGSNSPTSLTEAQTGVHFHTIPIYESETGNTGVTPGGPTLQAFTKATNTAGGGQEHGHDFSGNPINLAVKYMNMIRATRN